MPLPLRFRLQAVTIDWDDDTGDPSLLPSPLKQQLSGIASLFLVGRLGSHTFRSHGVANFWRPVWTLDGDGSPISDVVMPYEVEHAVAVIECYQGRCGGASTAGGPAATDADFFVGSGRLFLRDVLRSVAKSAGSPVPNFLYAALCRVPLQRGDKVGGMLQLRLSVEPCVVGVTLHLVAIQLEAPDALAARDHLAVHLTRSGDAEQVSATVACKPELPLQWSSTAPPLRPVGLTWKQLLEDEVLRATVVAHPLCDGRPPLAMGKYLTRLSEKICDSLLFAMEGDCLRVEFRDCVVRSPPGSCKQPPPRPWSLSFTLSLEGLGRWAAKVRELLSNSCIPTLHVPPNSLACAGDATSISGLRASVDAELAAVVAKKECLRKQLTTAQDRLKAELSMLQERQSHLLQEIQSCLDAKEDAEAELARAQNERRVFARLQQGGA